MNNSSKENSQSRGNVRSLQDTMRNYKDTLFRMIFNGTEELLQLYNAVNGTNYEDADELQIVTLDNAIYMNMKNDIAFIVDCRINLYEQQASVNPNMPLRDLFYIAKEYQGMVSQKTLYSQRKIKLPAPYFVVFYNGTASQPERKIMRLSDSFLTRIEEPALELKVVQLNIGEGHNRKLMEKCPILAQYSRYVGCVRRYVSEMSLNEAVECAVRECIKEGVLAEFLQKNKAEAIAVSIFEYDEERERELLRQEAIEDGREKGLAEGRMQVLFDLVLKGLLPVKTAAEEAGMTTEEFEQCRELFHAGKPVRFGLEEVIGQGDDPANADDC